MQSRLAVRGAGAQNFHDVELAAGRGPAGTIGRAVLKSARDLSVEEPEGGHIGFETGGAV